MASRRRLFIRVAACALLASGCTGQRAEERQVEAAESASTVAAPELTGLPSRGTCWQVAPEHLVPDHWFDDSPRVSCAEEHSTQTAAAVSVPEPTVAMAKRVGDDCWDYARKFIGVDEDHWIPWQVLVFLPSRQQVAAGASWVRCDVGIPAYTTGLRQLSVSRSVESAALEPPGDLWGCLRRSPLDASRQSWHECGVEHRYEATGTLSVVRGLDGYPSRAQRERQGAPQCRQDLTPDQRARRLAALAAWDPPGGLADGQLFGSCWAYRPDGEPLPPLR
jgi:hypothetical protein